MDAKNYTGLTEDDLIGDLLYNTIASYFAELDGKDEITAMSMGIVRYRAPSIGTFSLIVHVQEVFGIPIGIRSKGMMMDVDRVMQSVFAKDGNLDNVNSICLLQEAILLLTNMLSQSNYFQHLINQSWEYLRQKLYK